MAALDTVQDYVTAARVQLQDTVEPYRYPNADLLEALNFALLEARRVRPDLFVGRFNSVPSFSVVDSTTVTFEPQYRPAIVLFMAGYAQLRDAEEGQDTRAAGLIAEFKARLVGV